nr:hypothetical protein [Sphingobium estronivorans]
MTPYFLFRSGQLPQNRPRVPRQGFARLRCSNPLGAAQQKARAQIRFHIPHMVRKGGLGDVEACGGPRKGAPLQYGDEIAQLSQIYRHVIIPKSSLRRLGTADSNGNAKLSPVFVDIKRRYRRANKYIFYLYLALAHGCEMEVS